MSKGDRDSQCEPMMPDSCEPAGGDQPCEPMKPDICEPAKDPAPCQPLRPNLCEPAGGEYQCEPMGICRPSVENPCEPMGVAAPPRLTGKFWLGVLVGVIATLLVCWLLGWGAS